MAQIPTMSGDEQKQGWPLMDVLFPSDFDAAVQAMYSYFSDHYSYIQNITYLGWWRPSNVKKFLRNYIDISFAINNNITAFNKGSFVNELIAKGYEQDTANEYIKVFLILIGQNKIPENIYNASEYIPTKTNIIHDTFGKYVAPGMKTAALWVGGGLITYGLLRTLLIQKMRGK